MPSKRPVTRPTFNKQPVERPSFRVPTGLPGPSYGPGNFNNTVQDFIDQQGFANAVDNFVKRPRR